MTPAERLAQLHAAEAHVLDTAADTLAQLPHIDPIAFLRSFAAGLKEVRS